MKKTVVSEIFKASDHVTAHGVRRDPVSILNKSVEEIGELATEIGIKYHGFYKTPGKDGILGEAIDVINCMVDLIHIEYPNLTEDDIVQIVSTKLEKWKIKTGTVKV